MHLLGGFCYKVVILFTYYLPTHPTSIDTSVSVSRPQQRHHLVVSGIEKIISQHNSVYQALFHVNFFSSPHLATKNSPFPPQYCSWQSCFIYKVNNYFYLTMYLYCRNIFRCLHRSLSVYHAYINFRKKKCYLLYIAIELFIKDE